MALGYGYGGGYYGYGGGYYGSYYGGCYYCGVSFG